MSIPDAEALWDAYRRSRETNPDGHETLQLLHQLLAHPDTPGEVVQAVAEEGRLDPPAAEQVYNHPNTSTRARVAAGAADPTLKARTGRWLKKVLGNQQAAAALQRWEGDRSSLGRHTEALLATRAETLEVYATLVEDQERCRPEDAERLLALAREVTEREQTRPGQ